MAIRKRIDTLQMIRCFAILGICLSHTNFSFFVSLGAWGTSVFFILSGFVMTYNYYKSGNIKSVSVKDNLHFVVGKIKRLYPLYIITTLLMFIRLVIGEETISINVAIFRLVLNFFLVQMWLPFSECAINGPAWFLSVTVILYFIFPYINTYMEKKYNKRKASCMIIASLIIQYSICFIGAKVPCVINVEPLATPVMFQEWIVYNAPMTRFFDFFIGCNLAYIFILNSHDLSKIKYSLLELIAIILVIISNIISVKLDGRVRLEKNVFVFTIGVVLLIYSFAVGRGIFSNILTNKVTVNVGNLSSYIFLIHMPVYTYLFMFIYRIPFVNGKAILDKYYSWIEITVGFVIILLLSEMYVRFFYKKAHVGENM